MEKFDLAWCKKYLTSYGVKVLGDIWPSLELASCWEPI